MVSRTISTLEGDTFVVSDERGDMNASPSEAQGLFHRDTRMLSRWCLTVDGQRLNVLSIDDLNYFRAQFFLVPGTGTVYVDAGYSIIRTRSVGAGFHEDLTILNHGRELIELTVRIDVDSDFADLFEVKDALTKKGERYCRTDDARVVLGYRREHFVRETWISASAPVQLDGSSLTFDVQIAPHGDWTTCLDVLTGVDGCVVGALRAYARPR